MDLDDAEKQECQFILEEYKRLTNEVSKRLDYCDKNISYQFTLLGIVVTAITTITTKESDYQKDYIKFIDYILLSSPIIFYFLGFYYSINNIFILKIGQYLTSGISDKINGLLKIKTKSLLCFEHHFQNKVLLDKNKNAFVAFIVLHWTLLMPGLLLVVYLILIFYHHETFDPSQVFLLVLNVLLMIISVNINLEQKRIIDFPRK